MDLVRLGVLFAVLLWGCRDDSGLTVRYDTAAGARPEQSDRASLSPETLRAAVSDPEGAADRVRDLFWQRGYASCRVSRKGNTLVVWAGPRVKLGRLRIEGDRWRRVQGR